MIACEYAMWNVLPVLRRELAKIMVEEMGYSQKEVAKMLGVSEAAISNYLKGKRGVEKINREFKKKIRESARRIPNNGVEKEICSLCRYWLASKGLKTSC